ncbi:ribulose-phosphate 3-epimerase [Candidatus Daviesbacteria bacterium]|nr:ribulose-phosphate 3-epimerase [Candidatus Daviesbacteria bacterium]
MIIPSILATTEEEYIKQLNKIMACPEVFEGWVQIDLMDNKFVQNQSVGLDTIAKYPTNLNLEAHLMVEDPVNWIEQLAKLGFKRVIFHLEINKNIDEVIEKIRNSGMEVGLALSPETPVEKLTPFIAKIDLVLLLSVHPGFSGQEFILDTINRVGKVGRLRSSNKFLIEVDGGIDERIARDLVCAGADNLVIGSHLTNGNIFEHLKKIRAAIQD